MIELNLKKEEIIESLQDYFEKHECFRDFKIVDMIQIYDTNDKSCKYKIMLEKIRNN